MDLTHGACGRTSERTVNEKMIRTWVGQLSMYVAHMCSLLTTFHCLYYSYKPQAFILKIDHIMSAKTSQLVRSALFHVIIATVGHIHHNSGVGAES